MKPQREKAIEIFDKFYDIPVNWDTAKDCARIVVEEIILAIDWHEFETPNKQLDFWNGVLKEIDNL